MNELEKSYNKYKNLYRWEKKPIGIRKWKKQFEKKWVILELEKHGFKTNNFEFRIKPYKPYFLWRVWWRLQRFSKKFQLLMQNKYIRYIAKYLIIPISVILIATIIYDKYVKSIL